MENLKLLLREKNKASSIFLAKIKFMALVNKKKKQPMHKDDKRNEIRKVDIISTVHSLPLQKGKKCFMDVWSVFDHKLTKNCNNTDKNNHIDIIC